MENIQDEFAKQFHCKEETDPTEADTISVCPPSREDCYHLIRPYVNPEHRKRDDQPIDLTRGSTCDPEIDTDPDPAPVGIIISRGVPKLEEVNDPVPDQVPNQGQLQVFFRDSVQLQITEAKQAEILRAAQSLFCKRTRTLYHWMYPNASSQQIKIAVAESWENLGAQEKQFYISQVLVRFGFPQSNLMVNPQLCGIRHFPPLTTSTNANSSQKELQSAVSSISSNSRNLAGPSNPSMGGETRKRQGRPLGSKNKKSRSESIAYKITKDFQDDPELSNELEKFAVTFNGYK